MISRFVSLVFLSVSFVVVGCNNQKPLFDLLPATQTGVTFKNTITENDSINVLDYEYVYNGSGVGIGDFNNDGLPDIYFSGNMVKNALYLNKGAMHFENVAAQAAVEGEGKWCTGVAVVDINNDGWTDIYVCAARSSNKEMRKNILYINHGLNREGFPVFKDEAEQYGLADTSFSTQAAFFDYDNDGDLDMYLLVAGKMQKGVSPNIYKTKTADSLSTNTDRLFRNDWDSSLNHPIFTNVSKAAGINIEGFGLGVNVTDINKDGWKDIFVSNDYLSNDLLWINNKNGTFTEKAGDYFKHTSFSAMGNEVEDLNNDGLVDIIELDMAPHDNFRKKMMVSANSYQSYQNFDYYGYQYEYGRNTLQLNQGFRPASNDSIGDPIFSDIGYMSGIAETDWSWTPLVTDFDNDGYRDIIITNGFPKDLSDHDFVAFRNKAYSVASKKQLLDQLPQAKLHNYAYQNKSDLTFSDVSSQWGLETASFSNGAAYADFDNDGDLDIVINNINDDAFIYKNTVNDIKENRNHYINLKLSGDNNNKNALGAWIEIYYDGNKRQVYENTPYRGYLSTIQNLVHFGIGKATFIDSMLITWPTGSSELLRNIRADQLLKVDIKNAGATPLHNLPITSKPALFKQADNLPGLDYQHKEFEFIDFNVQKLLPHKFSEYGPALAVADVDGNGLDDIIEGGSVSFSPQVFLQLSDRKFARKSLLTGNDTMKQVSDDMGILVFDADGDNDNDIYIASGGYEQAPNSVAYQDKFYRNQGGGIFKKDTLALPQNYVSKSCVRATDYDNDGDLDLFIAGRVEPWNYPKAVSSFIYRNDSKDGKIRFTNVTSTIAKSLHNVGLVCDAVWTDFNNDGWQDLVLTGEWMSLRFFQNIRGVFNDVTAATGIADKVGWWNSLLPGDFDNDGDIDYIAGNLGLNSVYKATTQYPVGIYAKDFNNDGSYDAIPTLYLPTSEKNQEKKEYPAAVRDDMTKQLIAFKSKYQNYKTYANATFQEMFSKEELKDALKLQATELRHAFIRNEGRGKFTMSQLPTIAQSSIINGMVAEDFDGDGNLDVVINGNDYGSDVSIGRYDAFNGLILKGDGHGSFVPVSIAESGIFIPGNGKALVKFRSSKGKTMIAASQNKGKLKVFELRRDTKPIALQPLELSVTITYKNGIRQKREIGYGSSFLSQSGRFLNTDTKMSSVEIKNSRGQVRRIRI